MNRSTDSKRTLRLSRRSFLQAGAGSVGLMTLLGLAGCTPAAPGTAPAAEPGAVADPAAPTGGGTMTIGYETDILQLDPGIQQAGVDWPPAALVYSRLVEYDDSMMDPIPGLAHSWEVSDDGLTYTFHLREGVLFHTGRELTSADVEFTFDRHFEIGSAGRFLGYMIAVDSYEATGPYEFVINLKQQDVTFFPNLAVMSASIVDMETLDQIDTLPIGTGPYEFVEWVPGERVVYRKFEDYFDQDSLALWPDEIITTPIPEPQTRIAALQSGQIDIATGIPAELIQQVEADSSLSLIRQELSASYLCVLFNMERPPFQDNKLLRQAIARAIDTETINRNVFFGAGQTGCNLIPQGHWAYTDIDCPGYDPEAARALLDEAGIEPGFAITMRAFSDRGFGIPVAEIIQSNLRDVGIELEIEPLEWSFYVQDAWVGRNFDMTLGWYTREIDPDGLFSSVLRQEQGNNPMRYYNPEVEELFDLGKATEDEEERKRIYEEIMRIAILDDTPLVKLQSMEIVWAANQRVEGFSLLAKGLPNFYDYTWRG